MSINQKSINKFNIPMSSPDITDIEREAVAAVLNTPNLSRGEQIIAFEAAFKNFTGCSHAIGVSSGTAGLHLSVLAAGVGDGDWVLTTPFSFVASANALLFERAVPIFVDVDPVSGNINPDLVSDAVVDLFQGGSAAQKWLPRRRQSKNSSLKAILPVDVFGQPVDMDPIFNIATQYDLKIIEDSCEALGSEYKGRIAGTLGDYGVFAFYPNKQITTGEGAVVVTNDDEGANLIRALRNQGRSPVDHWLNHTYLGYNYRLDEMSAALGRAQMTRIEVLLAKRNLVASWYTQRLAEVSGVETPKVTPSTTKMSWFVYVVRIEQGISRDLIATKLHNLGIPVRPYFIPIHIQPYMTERFGYQQGDFPVTEDLGRRGLALPFSSVMKEEQVDYICQVIKDVISNSR